MNRLWLSSKRMVELTTFQSQRLETSLQAADGQGRFPLLVASTNAEKSSPLKQETPSIDKASKSTILALISLELVERMYTTASGGALLVVPFCIAISNTCSTAFQAISPLDQT
jgi:hypothetical protein